ncbi:hypothetical protein RB195_017486 [Necator americanus]|uniref:ShKT domain-containing protein n=1 Tax=Necator americanus TaxID=51031 RepID=A0ABR1C7D4_NECAM
MFLPDTRSSYCKILCLDAILQTRVFTGFRLDCRAEKSNECYQNLCRLVNKHPTSECPGICRFTAAEYNRIEEKQQQLRTFAVVQVSANTYFHAFLNLILVVLMTMKIHVIIITATHFLSKD